MVALRFFPLKLEDLQLDIVGFLAILGEASVLANAQVVALSKLSFCPRLLPAPQALIRYARPERLQPLSTGRVVASHSGNSRPQLNHVASILHDNGDQLPDYSVHLVKLDLNSKGALVKSSWKSPLTGLIVLGAAMSLTLIALSVYFEDGCSLLATLCLSILSTLVGIGSKWDLKLPVRKAEREVPRSDVIIFYPHGTFIIVKCNEETQRQLYWHPEKCDYMVDVQTYRFISLTGTLLLMAGVIFLANAEVTLQIAWAVAYVFLNAAYWVVAALPQRLHWDLSAYSAKTINIVGCGIGNGEPTFTQALWHAIAITGSSDWARDFDIAPNSEVWDEWLKEAGRKARAWEDRDVMSGTLVLPDWDPAEQLSRIMSNYQKKEKVEMRV